MPVDTLDRNDQGPAEYRSRVIEEIRSKETFENFNEFYNYANTYSIFDRDNIYY